MWKCVKTFKIISYTFWFLDEKWCQLILMWNSRSQTILSRGREAVRWRHTTLGLCLGGGEVSPPEGGGGAERGGDWERGRDGRGGPIHTSYIYDPFGSVLTRFILVVSEFSQGGGTYPPPGYPLPATHTLHRTAATASLDLSEYRVSRTRITLVRFLYKPYPWTF